MRAKYREIRTKNREYKMEFNENDFFRRATLLICSSLDIEKVLQRCIEHMAGFMPVSGMYLNQFEPDLGLIRCLAMVTRDGNTQTLPPTPLSEEGIRLIESNLRNIQQVQIVNQPELNPIARSLLQNFDLSNLSFMVMPLTVEGVTLGALGIMAEGKGRYDESHEHLVTQLREPFAMAMSNALRHREILRLKEIVEAENRELYKELGYISVSEIVGADFGLKRIMEMVRQVAPIDTPVMLLGETGVGKEVIANAIHYLSRRRNAPLVRVNCGAIPGSLLDSELFGHEKGAFTGAIEQKRGRFERAHRGSIFLDEIGELSPQAQVRLLRVIQNNEIERVGGKNTIPIDVRIIAATHRNLDEMIAARQFREDLWYRINTFPITIPPLRHRKEDIPALIHYFLERKSKDLKIHTLPVITAADIERLKAYDWPGNIRELENLIERSLIRSRGRNESEPLRFNHFTFPEKTDETHGLSAMNNSLLTLDEAMSKHIQRALQLTGGKISGHNGAAQLLGINPNTLRSRMRKMGIPFTRSGVR
jgi:transcriptional regulator with GAF, ATPase, and Fis domain